ncbi:MAG: type I 3-dehydroquinate dehydratase [Euryarchaeota archaeon]|nr:type I 3-dehydroquinate dehydratase [Euryarchaeota archaeon]MDE1837112.1 type I 3-dehydroquinate dehydratase [Euryarchaeota archaeon]MDE1879676.1 type I 3-dehydroquinate dehydratase [Euryarchaeota archaeon]MDE2045202.1 type I 3-dehydroquinate dehydratase [Thermoplasmata archaeon]
MGARDHAIDPEVLAPRPGHPLLVATLPGRKAEDLRTEVQQAAEAGADLVEFRLDRLSRGEVGRLERVHELPLLHPWVPAIATLRSKAEGGEGPDDLPSRRKLVLEALDSLPFSFVDLEVARDLPMREELRSAEGRRLGVVGSAHLPAGTPTEKAVRTLRAAMQGNEVAKVVLPAPAGQVVREILPALESFRGSPYVCHTTGGAGSLLRVLAPRLGMAWVYCRLPGDRGVAEVERSQVPLDRMRRFINSGPEAPWMAVVGNPIGHTLSPDLQASFLKATHTEGIYVALELTSEEEFMTVLPALRRYGLRGVNATRPFKRAAYQLAKVRSEHASASAAVNTLVADPADPTGFRGHNTDVSALLRWWGELEKAGTPLDRVLVVGTGGAARAAVLASVLHGAQVFVLGRRPERVQELVHDFPPETVHAIPPGSLREFPLVVHATPVGQEGEEGGVLEVPLQRALGSGSLLVDLVYRPRASTVQDLVKAPGARYVDGMRMLVYQAAETFRLFTGTQVPDRLVEEWVAPAAEGVAA